tara:strand:+ start:1635 stop:2186 length:552 start_codon:yes stop_codon:yes gene_type:complete
MEKDLNYYKNNCEEDYLNTPISVLKYINELENTIEKSKSTIYRFSLPIGDWSQDGHNMCDYFTIKSNVPVKYCIDPYIQACQIYEIDKLCSKLGEDTIDEDDVNFLVDEGFDRSLFPEFDSGMITTENLARIVITSIMIINPSIKLEIINNDIPTFNNWLGQKVKNVNDTTVFKLPGYGCHSM